MWAIDLIVQKLNNVSSYFYAIYLETLSWVYPFYLVTGYFYWLSSVFSSLAWHFSDFGTWVNQVGAELTRILDWSTIWSNILSYVPNLTAIRDWFYNWTGEVLAFVNTWWSTTSWQVQSWIDQATANIDTLISQAEAAIVDLRSSWDDFWTVTWPAMLSDLGSLRSSWGNFLANILPGLATWAGVGDLIDSELRSWFPFYDELAAAWGGIQAFFTDPEDQVLKILERSLERFW
ncbi:hypothetical protein LCGC14_0915760 [marine sediment metagenome]|uniref:Uncharacterized protein n=1 Tax=marine sediment metagenome TaxID=412755 RepID=A0A0F9NX31_9ZZZZ